VGGGVEGGDLWRRKLWRERAEKGEGNHHRDVVSVNGTIHAILPLTIFITAFSMRPWIPRSTHTASTQQEEMWSKRQCVILLTIGSLWNPEPLDVEHKPFYDAKQIDLSPVHNTRYTIISLHCGESLPCCIAGPQILCELYQSGYRGDGLRFSDLHYQIFILYRRYREVAIPYPPTYPLSHLSCLPSVMHSNSASGSGELTAAITILRVWIRIALTCSELLQATLIYSSSCVLVQWPSGMRARPRTV